MKGIQKYAFLPFFAFIAFLLLFGLLKQLSALVSYSYAYIWFNITIFLLLILSFFILFGVYIKRLNVRALNKSDLYIFSANILISTVVVFVLLKHHMIPGAMYLHYVMQSLTGQEFFFDFMTYPKTYFPVLLTGIRIVTDANVGFSFVLTLNRFISIFMLLMVFYTARNVFKDNLKAYIVLFTLIGLRIFHVNLSSILHTTWALFFVICFAFFLVKFLEKKSLLTFSLMNISLLLAGYMRFELMILLGLPYLFMIGLFWRKHKYTYPILLLFTVLAMSVSLPVIASFTNLNDPGRTFDDVKEPGFAAVLQQAAKIGYKNIFEYHDLGLWRLTLFDYGAILASATLLVFLVYNVVRRSERFLRHKWSYFFAAFYLFFLVMNLLFTKTGLRYSHKYLVQVEIFGIILVYYMIHQIFEHKLSDYKKYGFVGMFLFFILAAALSSTLSFSSYSCDDPTGIPYLPKLTFQFPDDTRPETYEYLTLKNNNISIDRDCKILKINYAQPELDFYYGLQDNILIVGYPPSLPDKYVKKSECFYFLNQEYIQDIEFKFDVNMSLIDSELNGCSKEIVYTHASKVYPYTLFKYTC